MSELKPCPFCGGKARIRQVKTKDVDEKFHPVFGDADKIYVVGCETWDCLLYLCDRSPHLMFPMSRRENAVNRWNRRAE